MSKSPINPTLHWLFEMMKFFDTSDITIPGTYHAKVYETKQLMQSDTSGIVNSMLDFAVNCALVDFTIETDNIRFTSLIDDWFKNINNILLGRVETGISGLAKEYYRERWKNSSFIVLRTIWDTVEFGGTTLELPVKMWFVDGLNIEVEDQKDNRIIGEEKYYLKLNNKDRKILPSSKNELIFIQKPFDSWNSLYPTPYIVQRGLFRNLKLFNLLNQKSEKVIGKAVEYLMMLKKGTEQLALKGNSDFIYSEEDLKKVKQDFSKMLVDNKQTTGTPTYTTNFDTEISHLIPDFKLIMNSEIYAPIQNRLLAGLGMIEIVEGIASTRRDSLLNPKPFIAEVEQGIEDFISLITDVLKEVKNRNLASHKKYFGSNMQLHYTPIKDFINENLRGELRQLYDRGLLSKQTYTEVVGDVDIDIEAIRKTQEEELGYKKIFALPPSPKGATTSRAVKGPPEASPALASLEIKEESN